MSSEEGLDTSPLLERESQPRTEDIEQILRATISRKLKHVVLEREEDARLLESKGFGIREKDQFYLRDYEALYLIYTGKMTITIQGKKTSFQEFVDFASRRDSESWTRFLIFRDLRTRGYVVREGFGFPIDFRVYDRGDYGEKAAKYIVFGLIEGKTMNILEFKDNINQMSNMGKEAVVAVVERRGEVIYYKVGRWRPHKPL